MSAAIDARMHPGGADNRTFSYAVLFSLLLHAALLFSFSLRQPSAPPVAPGPIVARLAPASAPAPIPIPAQPEAPKPRIEEAPPPPQVKPPPPKALPAPKAAPAPRPKAKTAPISPAPSAAPAEPAKPPVAAVPSAPASPSAGPVPPLAKADPAPSAPTAPPADAGTLETYRMDLLRMARNYKRYPRVAMDNNWEGRAVVRMVIGANGLISSITVISTSGHEILDKQAVDMIQKAKPRVQIPAALRGKEFPVEIPVIYSLKDPAA